MDDNQKLAALKLRLPDAPENVMLLVSLLEEAAAQIKAMTGREEVPPALSFAQIKLATIAYNRMGVEGQNSHSEGGVSAGLDSYPEALQREINAFRVAKTR